MGDKDSVEHEEEKQAEFITENIFQRTPEGCQRLRGGSSLIANMSCDKGPRNCQGPLLVRATDGHWS